MSAPASHDLPLGNATTRRSVVLRRRPRGEPEASDFEIQEDPIPTPGPGEVVTRTIWLSIDPYTRGRLREEQICIKACTRSAPRQRTRGLSKPLRTLETSSSRNGSRVVRMVLRNK